MVDQILTRNSKETVPVVKTEWVNKPTGIDSGSLFKKLSSNLMRIDNNDRRARCVDVQNIRI